MNSYRTVTKQASPGSSKDVVNIYHNGEFKIAYRYRDWSEEAVAKELDLLKASKGSLEQSLSYPLFMENLNRLKVQTEYAGKKLQVLNSALEKGLTEPTKEFYELDKQQNAALKALEKTPEQRLKDMGFTIKRRS